MFELHNLARIPTRNKLQQERAEEICKRFLQGRCTASSMNALMREALKDDVLANATKSMTLELQKLCRAKKRSNADQHRVEEICKLLLGERYTMESRDEMVRASSIKKGQTGRARNKNYVETKGAKLLTHRIGQNDTTVEKHLKFHIGCFNEADIEILRKWHHDAAGTYLNQTGPPENPDKREVHFRHQKNHTLNGGGLNFISYWMKVKAYITKSERKK
jgi:hypothetical protein